jgi:transposase-like protein
MRYADGGGLSERGRATREAVRLQAAEWFVQDVPVTEIASRLRVSTNAVYVWRRCWRAGGRAALASKGPGGSACRLDRKRLDRLAQALEWSRVRLRTASVRTSGGRWRGWRT